MDVNNDLFLVLPFQQ